MYDALKLKNPLSPPKKIPLSPNIHIQILHADLYTFPQKISGKNLLKDQTIFPLVNISLIFLTFPLEIVRR